jgi:hypothetical protein
VVKLHLTFNLDGDIDSDKLDDVLRVYGLNLARVIEKVLRNWLRKALGCRLTVFCSEIERGDAGE